MPRQEKSACSSELAAHSCIWQNFAGKSCWHVVKSLPEEKLEILTHWSKAFAEKSIIQHQFRWLLLAYFNLSLLGRNYHESGSVQAQISWLSAHSCRSPVFRLHLWMLHRTDGTSQEIWYGWQVCGFSPSSERVKQINRNSKIWYRKWWRSPHKRSFQTWTDISTHL